MIGFSFLTPTIIQTFYQPLVLLGVGALIISVLAYLAKLLRQPLLLAYIITGILIGPVFGLISSTHEGVVFFSELGIALLLFSIGIESDFSKLKKISKIVIPGTIIHVGLTTLITFFIMNFLALNLFQSILIGLILSFSSTAVVIKILTENNVINTLHGRFSLGFLLVQDFLIILGMPLITEINSAALAGNISIGILGQVLAPSVIIILLAKGAGLFALGMLLNKYLFPWLLRYSAKSSELLYLITLTNCFTFISISILLNLPMAIGAFIAGLAMSTFPYTSESMGKIHGLRDFFAVIFFVALGMQITLSSLVFAPLLIIAFFLIVYVVKPILFGLIILQSGYDSRTATYVSFSLAQVSEFSLILALAGIAVLGNQLYTLIVIIASVSMITTPYMMKYSEQLYKLIKKIPFNFSFLTNLPLFKEKMQKFENLPEKKFLKDHIILVGSGMTGEGIIKLLSSTYNIIAIDHDPEIIYKLINEGHHAIYGNISNNELLEKINFKKAKLLIITIPDVKESIKLVKKAKTKKNLVVFARARTKENAFALYRSGVDFVIMPEVLGGNMFLKNIANFLETGKVYNIRNLEDEFLNYLKEEAKNEKKEFVY